MYGAEWCPHCKREKALFGSSWKYVPYVECPENTKLCLDKGVKGYPTWIAADGTKYEGEQGLEKISAATQCPLPN
jgi:glutaredoxin